MNNNATEKRKNIEVAEELLQKYDLLNSAKEFLETGEVKGIMDELFLKQCETAKEHILDTAPESLKGTAEKALNMFTSAETEEAFKEDLRQEFICQIAFGMSHMPAKYLIEILDPDVLKSMFEEGKEDCFELLHKIGTVKIERHMEFFSKCLAFYAFEEMNAIFSKERGKDSEEALLEQLLNHISTAINNQE